MNRSSQYYPKGNISEHFRLTDTSEWRIKSVDITDTNLKLSTLSHSGPCLKTMSQNSLTINGYNLSGNPQSFPLISDCFTPDPSGPEQVPDNPSVKPSSIVSANEIFYNYYYKPGESKGEVFETGLFDSEWKITMNDLELPIMQFKYDIRENDTIQFSWVFDTIEPGMFTINTHSISDIAQKINTDSDESTYTLKLEDINTINGGAILFEDIVGETIFPTITLLK